MQEPCANDIHCYENFNAYHLHIINIITKNSTFER